MMYLRWIARFWHPHRHWIWILFALTLISSAFALIFPYLLRIAIDTAAQIAGETGRTLENYPTFIRPLIDRVDSWFGDSDRAHVGETTWKVVLLLGIVGILRSLSHLYPGFRAMINAKLSMDIRRHHFGLIIDKGYKFFLKFRTGDLVTRLTDDIEGWQKIAWFSCSGIFRALESTSKFIFCIAFMLMMNWKLALISIAPLPVMLFIFYRVRLKLTEVALQRQNMISSTNDALEAAFSGVRIIKAFSGEEGQSRSFRKLLDERIAVELRFQKLWFLVWNMYGATTSVGQLIVIVLGGSMVINNTLSVGEFYAFYVYLGMLLQPLIDIPLLFVSSRTAFACIDREIEIETSPGGTEDIFIGKKPTPDYESFEIRNASFQYSDDATPVIENINISLKKGEKAAIVGSVGSGKSTLVKIAAGLYPPTDGKILYNGQPLNEYNIDSFRRRVGYIPQEANLFSESVKDNISFGRNIDENRITDSLAHAQVLEEMKKLPDGLNQILGQKGLTVSGGQKQRLAIARALAGNPDILLMDDCTSALDAENERRFWDMFAERFPNASCLIVTHRLATARQADVIYVMDDGKIVGKGTHAELLETCDEYRNFLSKEELRAALRASVK